MFDETILNAAVASVFCNKAATWTSPAGAVGIMVALTVLPIYDETTFKIMGESITAGCPYGPIATMARGDTLVIGAATYKVLSMLDDEAGWATITLEKQ